MDAGEAVVMTGAARDAVRNVSYHARLTEDLSPRQLAETLSNVAVLVDVVPHLADRAVDRVNALTDSDESMKRSAATQVRAAQMRELASELGQLLHECAFEIDHIKPLD